MELEKEFREEESSDNRANGESREIAEEYFGE